MDFNTPFTTQEKAEAFRTSMGVNYITLEFLEGFFVVRKEVSASRTHGGRYQKFSDWMRGGGHNTSVVVS